VKFESSDSLPPILNALETENNGQKLVLEVAVSILKLQYV
jgi:F-type H+-transporting ATPase subunit beta